MALNFFRKRSKQEEEKHDWKASGSFVRKPIKGWLHTDRLLEGSGVAYEAKYVGAVKIISSMRQVPADQRGAVVREAISKCCLESKMFNFKPSKVSLTHGVIGDVHLQNSGKTMTVTFSKSHVKVFVADTMIYQHPMECISFASLGEQEYNNLVAYVSKDPILERACFIFECVSGLANDLILTIGQAFELKYKEYLNKNPIIQPSIARFGDPSNMSAHKENYYDEAVSHKDHTYDNHLIEGGSDGGEEYDHLINNSKRPSTPEGAYNTLNMNVSSGAVSPSSFNGFDFAPGASFMGTDGNMATIYDNPIAAANARAQKVKPVTTNGDYKTPSNKPANIPTNTDLSSDVKDEIYLAPSPTAKIKPSAPAIPVAPQQIKRSNRLKISEDIKKQPWFHGVLAREAAESLIIIDGEFLVRESGGSKGQYVLTGMKNGTHRHLLLVDPEGKVRTRDHSFDTVAGLIAYHMTHNIPICSGSSEVYLIHDVHDLRRDTSDSFAI